MPVVDGRHGVVDAGVVAVLDGGDEGFEPLVFELLVRLLAGLLQRFVGAGTFEVLED